MLAATAPIVTKTYVDFFAGIGLFRLGMEQAGWSSTLEIDWDPQKKAMYEGHFGPGGYLLADISTLSADSVPDATLYHASFPCTDLSLAGGRAGLDGAQSSAFWHFVRILSEKGAARPEVVTLENVPALISSRGGADFTASVSALSDLGYQIDAYVIDAAHFVPQSRQRLFIVGRLAEGGDEGVYETQRALTLPTAVRPSKLLEAIRQNPGVNWRLFDVPEPPFAPTRLEDIIDPTDQDWWEPKRRDYLIGQMSERHLVVLGEMLGGERSSYATAFRRTRHRDGQRQSTAEMRSDGIAGCLRTPKGGSARQILIRAGRGEVQARLLNGRECARLMGAPDYSFAPDLSETDILFGFGDAVCSDAIEWLAENVLERLFEPVSTVFEPVDGVSYEASRT